MGELVGYENDAELLAPPVDPIGGEAPPEPLVAITFSSENQVAQMEPGFAADAPRRHGSVWLSDRNRFYTGELPATLTPTMQLARPDNFAIRIGYRGGEAWLGVIDGGGPAQLIHVSSGVPVVPVCTCGAAIDGSFARGAESFLAVYEDGTARLWDLTEDRSAKAFSTAERLRFTAPTTVKAAAFVFDPAVRFEVAPFSGVVTADDKGNIQLWTPKATTRTVEQVLAQ